MKKTSSTRVAPTGQGRSSGHARPASIEDTRRQPIYFLTPEQRLQFLADASDEGETASSFVRLLYKEWKARKAAQAA